jgi:hypothetical protein
VVLISLGDPIGSASWITLPPSPKFWDYRGASPGPHFMTYFESHNVLNLNKGNLQFLLSFVVGVIYKIHLTY